MTKESLMAMGLTEEQADKVLQDLGAGYVPKAEHDQLAEKSKQPDPEVAKLKDAIADRDKQLEALKKSAGENGDTAALHKQIGELQKANAEKDKAHAAELRQVKREAADTELLTSVKAKNHKAVKALLDAVEDTVDIDGYKDARKKQLEKLVKGEDTAFLFDSKKRKIEGAQPGSGSDTLGDGKPDFSKMEYGEIAAWMEANPDAKLE